MVLEYESVNSFIFLFQYYLFFVLERERVSEILLFFLLMRGIPLVCFHKVQSYIQGTVKSLM